jgi:hypothetical protein
MKRIGSGSGINGLEVGGAPWQNADFVETIQNQGKRIDTSFIKAINPSWQATGNNGIIMSGITIQQSFNLTRLTFDNALVFLYSPFSGIFDFCESPLTGTVDYNSGDVWIVASNTIPDARVFRNGGNSLFGETLNFSVVTTQPTEGSWIEISYSRGCSRLYKDVLSNACAKTGEIKQVAVLSSNIDFTTGRGKNEWYGWAIADGRNGTVNMSGRVPVGFVNGDNQEPANSPTKVQTNYGRVGNTGGLNNVQLTNNESGLPLHSHSSITTQYTNGSIFQAYTSGTGINLTVSTQQTGLAGANAQEVHENRQPYTVVLYMQKLTS